MAFHNAYMYFDQINLMHFSFVCHLVTLIFQVSLGFPFAIFTHRHNVIHFPHHSLIFLSYLPNSLTLIIIICMYICTYIYTYVYMCKYIYFRLGFCIWEKTSDLFPSESGLFHLSWWSLVSSIFLQMPLFCSSLWLNNTPLVYHTLFIHSSADGHLGWFHNLAIVNSAPVNMGVYAGVSIVYWLTSLWIYAQEWYDWIVLQFYF
jgi:hypothetical protein